MTTLRVLVFWDTHAWIAQGLERDICVQARSLSDLFGNFEIVLRLEEEEEGGLERIPPAPKHFIEAWERML